MSAGSEASVTLADPGAFRSGVTSTKDIDIGHVTNLVINEQRSVGWVLVTVPLVAERCWFILRRDLDAAAGTAEYACLVLTYDGLNIEACQYVLVQNDNDYLGGGIDRFGVFFVDAARVRC